MMLCYEEYGAELDQIMRWYEQGFDYYAVLLGEKK